MLESFMQIEDQKHKTVYFNLSRAIEFETILKECCLKIWQATDAQLNFWTHMQANVIDFNALDKDNDNIYKHSKNTEKLWKKLCNINPCYKPAIDKYSAYQRDIRNNEQVANDLQDSEKNDPFKKIIGTYTKNNETLFDERTAVLHISGFKETVGKILKANKGAQTVFGYSSGELLQSSINRLMPSLFSRRHNDLMEQHFKSGRNRLFNKERFLYGLHKEGYCFSCQLLVKPMPGLGDGFLQYVGMLLHVEDESEYIITDTNGTIDAISKGLSDKLHLSNKLLHKNARLNIQIIAPDLINCYQNEMKKNAKAQKFRETGGENLIIIIPRCIKQIFQQNGRRQSKTAVAKGSQEASNRLIKINNNFNGVRTGKKNQEITPSELFHYEEYKNPILKAQTKCEVQDLHFGLGKGIL